MLSASNCARRQINTYIFGTNSRPSPPPPGLPWAIDYFNFSIALITILTSLRNRIHSPTPTPTTFIYCSKCTSNECDALDFLIWLWWAPARNMEHETRQIYTIGISRPNRRRECWKQLHVVELQNRTFRTNNQTK